MDELSGKNFSGGLVFPDNKAFRKLCSARCSVENGKFPCSHISTATFPVCQKWAQKKQQIFFGFTASCAAAGYASAGAVNSRGIIPNNGYDRYNFTFRNTSSFLKDKMHQYAR